MPPNGDPNCNSYNRTYAAMARTYYLPYVCTCHNVAYCTPAATEANLHSLLSCLTIQGKQFMPHHVMTNTAPRALPTSIQGKECNSSRTGTTLLPSVPGSAAFILGSR